MTAREQCQALHILLSTARAKSEQGDRAAALEAVERALALDPDFLAAQCLRERIQRSESSGPLKPFAPREALEPQGLLPTSSFAADGRSGRGTLRLRYTPAGANHLHRRDALLPAAAVFGAIVLGSSWPEGVNVLRSRPTASIATLVEPPKQAPDAETTASFGTGGNATLPNPSADAIQSIVVEPERVPPKDSVRRELERVRAIIAAEAVVARKGEDAGAAEPAPSPALPLPDPVMPASPASEAVSPSPADGAALVPGSTAVAAANGSPRAVPVPTALPSAGDEMLIQTVLQRYRSAYRALDARSAREVWPGVNEAALSHAFDGLQSQTISFEACDIRVRGSGGGATCRGTASYVPKVGSQERRVEPRTWTFVLRKIGTDWIIQSVKTNPGS